jgi:nucleoside-diphosphate-sugar epimerase
MPSVIVTGGSGKLGREVVHQLLAAGWTVVNIDVAPSPRSAARWLRVDLSDFGQVVDTFSGVDASHDHLDAVVHLGAVPGPGQASNTTTYTNNALGSWNVFSAARLARIPTVVWASSETLFGYPFDAAPERLPLDEAAEPRPNVDYAMEKLTGEVLAGQLCRRDPQLSMTGLRFSNVLGPEDYAQVPSWQQDPLLRRWNLWSYIDVRDGARAVLAALEHRRPGCHVYAVFSADTVMQQPTQELVEEHYADVPRERDFTGHEALVSTAKAAAELGWRPQHSWRDASATR